MDRLERFEKALSDILNEYDNLEEFDRFNV